MPSPADAIFQHLHVLLRKSAKAEPGEFLSNLAYAIADLPPLSSESLDMLCRALQRATRVLYAKLMLSKRN